MRAPDLSGPPRARGGVERRAWLDTTAGWHPRSARQRHGRAVSEPRSREPSNDLASATCGRDTKRATSNRDQPRTHGSLVASPWPCLALRAASATSPCAPAASSNGVRPWAGGFRGAMVSRLSALSTPRRRGENISRLHARAGRLTSRAKPPGSRLLPHAGRQRTRLSKQRREG